MSSVSYASKYRDPAIEIEHGDEHVRIWVGNAGGQTFSKIQWMELIIQEATRMGLKRIGNG